MEVATFSMEFFAFFETFSTEFAFFKGAQVAQNQTSTWLTF